MSETDRRDSLDAGPGDRDLLQLLKRRERALLLEIRTAQVCNVIAFNGADQTVTVLVGALEVEDTELPVDAPDPPIQLIGVPVGFASGMGGLAYDTTQIIPDDTGLLINADRATEEWKRLGAPCDPIDARTHSFADAWFLPIARPLAGVLPPVFAGGRRIEAPIIQLGALASYFAVAAAPGGGQTALDAAIAALTTIVGTPIPEPPAPGAGAAIDAIAAALLALLQTLAISTKVQIETPP